MSTKTSPHNAPQKHGNCPECGGTGHVGMYQDRCNTCDGTGNRLEVTGQPVSDPQQGDDSSRLPLSSPTEAERIEQILIKVFNDFYDYITEKDIIKVAHEYSEKTVFKEAVTEVTDMLREARTELEMMILWLAENQYGSEKADDALGILENVQDMLKEFLPPKTIHHSLVRRAELTAPE